MRKGFLVAAVMFCALSVAGCKKQVPTDIVQNSLRNAMRAHAPITTSAMCGATVKGLISANVTNVVRNPDGKTGKAHVSGVPFFATGAPGFCEGDVEFKFSFTQKSSGTRKRKTTTTTWYLDHIKLLAVQTRGVAFKAAEEDEDEDDD